MILENKLNRNNTVELFLQSRQVVNTREKADQVVDLCIRSGLYRQHPAEILPWVLLDESDLTIESIKVRVGPRALVAFQVSHDFFVRHFLNSSDEIAVITSSASPIANSGIHRDDFFEMIHVVRR